MKTLATWFFVTAIFTVACANYDEGSQSDDTVVIPPDHGPADAGIDTPEVDAPVSEPEPDAQVSPDGGKCDHESTCVVDHDCGQNAACRDHKCRNFCNYDVQCEHGLSCRSGVCRPE